MSRKEITVLIVAVLGTLALIFNLRYNTLFLPESVLDEKCKKPVAFAGTVTKKYPVKSRPYIYTIEGVQKGGEEIYYTTVDEFEISLIALGDSIVKEKGSLTYKLMKIDTAYTFDFTSDTGCSMFVFY